MTSRSVYIDDTNPAIVYEGDWGIDNNAYPGVDDEIYQGSQHVATGSASMSFEFRGREFLLDGLLVVKEEGGEVQVPAWRCFVDDEEFPPLNNLTRPTNVNLFTYCYSGGVADVTLDPNVPHTLRIEVEGTSDVPIWMDRIRVIPPLDAPADLVYPPGYSVLISPTDPSVRLGPNWINDEESNARYTNDTSTFVEVEFVGTKLSWIGTGIRGQPGGQSRAFYSLNGAPEVPFSFTGFLGFNPGAVEFFETETLPQDQRHFLRVRYEGFDTPLALKWFLAENGDVTARRPDQSLPAATDLAQKGAPADTDSNSKSTPVGAIAGGVAGGVVLIILIFLGVFFYKRKKKQQAAAAYPVEIDAPNSSVGPGPAFYGAVGQLPSGAVAAPFNAQVPPTMIGDNGGNVYSKDPPPVSYPVWNPYAQGAPGKAPSPANFSGSSSSSPYGQSVVQQSMMPLLGSKAQVAIAADNPAPMTYHQDSGIRLGGQPATDVPPSYTPN